jgi:hypothetical protein
MDESAHQHYYVYSMPRLLFPNRQSPLDDWLRLAQSLVACAIALLLIIGGILLLYTQPDQLKLSISLWLLAIPFLPLIPFPDWVKVAGCLAGLFLLQS